MIRPVLAVVALAISVSACGGGSAGTTPPSAQPTPSASSQGGTGLIADVDRAVVVAVCANLKQASEIVGTNFASDQARAAIVDAISQLSKPPHPAGALKLVAFFRQEVRLHRTGLAVGAGLAWCTKQGA